jgi:PAS domain S-box-containing protein
MKDRDKTKEQLINELKDLRTSIVELENREKETRKDESPRERESTFREIAEYTNDGILIGLSDGFHVYANKMASKITGYSIKELLKTNMNDLLSHVEQKKVQKRFKMRIEGKPVLSKYETCIVRKDRKKVSIELSVSKISWQGKFAIMAIIRDITGRKQAEEELKKHRYHLEELVTAKTKELNKVNKKLNKDIIKCKRIEKEISNKNTFLSNIFEAIKHPFYIIDAKDYSIIQANSASGFDISNKKNTCYSLTHRRNEPCQGPEHNCPIEIVKKTNKPACVEHIHIGKNGDFKVIEINCYPLFDDDGKVTKVIEYALDITERKQTEETLRMINNAVESAAEGVVITNLEGEFVYVNHAFCQLYLLNRDEVLGKHFSFIVSEKDEIPLLIETLQKDGKHKEERKAVKSNGKEFDILLSAQFVTDKKSKPTHMMGIIKDITESKLAKEKLHDSEIRQKTVVESIDEALHLVDHNLHIQIFNKTFREWCKQLDINTDVIGKHIKDVFPFLPQKILSEYRQVFETGDTLITQETTKIGNKEIITETRKIPVKTNRKVTSVLTLVNDITKRILAEDALKTAKEKAEESDRLKSAFLATMSHEIRTPLNAINGFSELLLREELPDDYHKYIEMINSSGRSLLNIINDVLNLSVLEAGQLKVNKKQFSLRALFDDLKTKQKMFIAQKWKEIELRKVFPDEVDDFIIQDEQKVRQILTNLLNNAIKFADKGFIEYGVSLKDDKFLEFYVMDSGKGISLDKINDIFEPFRQEEEGFTRKYGGTGLGLTISKRLVDLMGGEIWLETKTGKDHGSTFYFTLPFTRFKKITRKKESKFRVPKKQAGKKIMIVEDEEYNSFYIKMLLNKAGYNTETAHNGQDAVCKYMDSSEIDLIIMDLRMPVKDGFQATREIRKIEEDEGLREVPIIALTAAFMENEEGRSMEAGCNYFLQKPFEHNDLLRAVAQYLKKKTK